MNGAGFQASKVCRRIPTWNRIYTSPSPYDHISFPASIYPIIHIRKITKAKMPLSQDRGPEIAAVASIFLGLTIIFLSLRCYCRGFILKTFGLDDWFAVLSGVDYYSQLT